LTPAKERTSLEGGKRMDRAHMRPVSLVSRLRWMIPLIFALLGIGSVLLEQLKLHGHPLSVPHVIFGVLYWGSVGPALAWLTLTWAVKAREAQQELAFRNRELAALNAIGEAASQSLELDQVLGTAMEKIVDLIGIQAGDIRLIEGERLILKSHYGVSPDFVVCERSTQIDHCLCGMCAKSGKIVAVNDLASDPSLVDSTCGKEGFLSIANIPLKSDGQVAGLIHVTSRQRHAFAPRHLQTLSAIGDRVATAIKNAQLYEEARRRAVSMESISLIGQRITSVLDLDSLMAQVVRLIRKRFGYYGQEGITGWVAHTGQALLCNDVSREPRYHQAELLPETRAEVAVPMRVGKRVIGVLDVQSDRCDAFDKQDVTVLQILGSQVGIAIENARLFRETRQRYEAMVALHAL
jgi:GAF domain-containing protein